MEHNNRVGFRKLIQYADKNNLQLIFESDFKWNEKKIRKHTAFFTDEIRKAMDNGMLTGPICFDLSKAFDTISHGSIIEKRLTWYYRNPTAID